MALTMQSATMTSVYEAIGVKPVINARGFMTVLGGSTPSARVKEAMEEAERYFVEMKDLLEKGGEIIAGLIGCEAAYITPGAAAALALGTAACVTGDDMEKMSRLPDTTGMKNQVIIQKCQRYSYDRAPTIVGTKLVEIGDENGTTPEQLEAAIGPQTANVLYVAHLEGRPGALSFDQTLEIAHRKGVPVLTDAAGQVYPIERMRSYTKRGADLVAFGAKYIGSVHSSGILCGKKALVDAAVPQGFIGFETVAERKTFGRPLKLDRQEIVGVITAVQEWFSIDHEKRVAELERRLGGLQRALQNAPGVSLEVVRREGNAPRALRIGIDPAKARRDAQAVVAGLRAGSPMILVGSDASSIVVNPATVDPRDDQLVVDRIRELLA
jgi:D-glucosaminate-6-phosphate ammonia-lyase